MSRGGGLARGPPVSGLEGAAARGHARPRRRQRSSVFRTPCMKGLFWKLLHCSSVPVPRGSRAHRASRRLQARTHGVACVT